jgi:NADH-quinone oxidoreductase subunit J
MSGILTAAVHPTIPDLITFIVAGLMVLAGAVGVILSRNPVHSALSLVLTLFGIAVLFIAQQAEFLAAVQVIVYAGAIVVLFLFVIMFLGVDKRENIESDPLRGQRPLAVVLMVVVLAAVIALGVNAHWATGVHHLVGRTGTPASNTARLGRSVFTTYLFAFEATAGLLVIAVVGAVVLARRPPESTGEADLEESEALGTGSDADGELGDGSAAALPEAAAAADESAEGMAPAGSEPA